MKKLFAVLAMVLMMGVGSAKAADLIDGSVYFQAGNLKLTIPMANLSVISLYDFWKGEGLMGGETPLVVFNDFRVNVGAVTSFQANGMPFVSVDYNFGKLMSNVPPFLAAAGLWVGHDFMTNDNRAGIKASIPLW